MEPRESADTRLAVGCCALGVGDRARRRTTGSCADGARYVRGKTRPIQITVAAPEPICSRSPTASRVDVSRSPPRGACVSDPLASRSPRLGSACQHPISGRAGPRRSFALQTSAAPEPAGSDAGWGRGDLGLSIRQIARFTVAARPPLPRRPRQHRHQGRPRTFELGLSLPHRRRARGLDIRGPAKALEHRSLLSRVRSAWRQRSMVMLPSRSREAPPGRPLCRIPRERSR